MHLVVELYFDEATETAIRSLWHTLASTGVSAGLGEIDSRPHISVAVYHELDLGPFQTALTTFAGERSTVDVTLASWGVFPTAECVVFLAPVVTHKLLVLHQDFHQTFAAFGDTSQSHYLPGQWVPHCTLATGYPPYLLPKVAEACQMVGVPLRGHLERIGLVEYYPRREHCTVRFAPQ